MNKCFLWIKQLLSKCLSVFQYSRIKSTEQQYQMSQMNQMSLGTDNIENNLKVELKQENYETELATQDLELQTQSQNQKLIQKQEIIEIQQEEYNIDQNQLREFIETTPIVDFNNIQQLIDIGNQSIESLKCILNEDYSNYEQLENNSDEFSYWIKYIETPDKLQIHQMRYKFTLNTTLENYIAFMKDLQLQKSLDTSVDQFECHYSDDQNLQINYLRYKKILFMDPRDFLYIKYTKFISDDTIIEISKSVENDEFQPFTPTTKTTTRALLSLSGNYIKQIGPKKLEVQTYSECNMKLKLKPIMTKTASKNEIKKLIKKYRDHFNQQ